MFITLKFPMTLLMVVVPSILTWTSCSTPTGKWYQQREGNGQSPCPLTLWSYRLNQEVGGNDSLMESSGRRNCRRFLGPESCLVRMHKESPTDYLAECTLTRNIKLIGNE